MSLKKKGQEELDYIFLFASIALYKNNHRALIMVDTCRGRCDEPRANMEREQESGFPGSDLLRFVIIEPCTCSMYLNKHN